MGMLTSLCQDAFKVAWMTLKHFVLFWTSLSWTGWGSFLVLLVVMVSVVGMPFFFWVSIWKAYRKEIPSGVPFSWWLGHVPFLWKSKSMHLETMYALQHQVFLSTHSKNTILYMPLETSYLITSDPNNIEHILKSNFKNYVKGPLLFRKNEILLGEGIFNVDGEAWKRQRKSASLLFNVKNFKHFMFEVFMKHGQMLTKKLDDAVVHETVVDLYDLLLRFTLDAFMEIGMGGHLNSLGDTHQPAFAIAFDRAQCIVASRLTLPYPIWALLEHINGKRKEVEQCMQLVNTFADTLIQDRQRAISVETNKNDLLSLFLNPSTFNGQTIQYSNKELRDISLNFIIAGRDTTAQALSWCIFLLCQHPTVLKKLREEIDTVCKESPMELDYDRVKSLSYAHFVFKETLRLYPSVPQEVKYAVNDDVWPDGTKIPAGQAVLWLPYVMGRLEYLWGPDALVFQPERWETESQPSPFKYPVFNAGPRVCLGQQMALLEGVYCLSKLVQKYDFELVNPNEVTYAEALTLPMKNGLRVRVSHRP